MRTFIPVVLMLVFSLSAAGQSTGFKNIQKKQAGTTAPDLKFRKINRQNTLKSTANQDQTFRSLHFQYGLKQSDPIVIRKGNGPVYIEKSVTPLKSSATATNEERFFRFMEESRQITNIQNPREQFKITDIHSDELGITHIKTLQYYKEVEIYGSESILHIDTEKERFTGSVVSVKKDIDIIPEMNYMQCLKRVRDDLDKTTHVRDLSAAQKKLLHYDAPDCSLVIYKNGMDEPVLAWTVTIRPNFLEEWKYFIDASNGNIIKKYNNTKSDGPMTGSALDLNNISRSIDVYLETSVYYLINFAESMYNPSTEEGVIVTFDANNTSTSNLNYSMVTSTDNAWTGKKSAVSAHYHAQLAYQYFLDTYGRNSINDQGGNIISFVNVAEDDGSSMENAFWNGQAVFYGNGGTHFKSLAGALDVAAHELGHGVVSNTANLEYQGQSGAMNETYADIFGSMVDRDDWLIGEDVVKTTYFPSGALRSMSDPHNQGDKSNAYWQPSHISEMYLGDQDNGGVHMNSGIGNYAFYLFATAVGKDKAEKVFYRALTEYLTKTSEFIDFRIAVVQAAKDLYGSNSAESTEAADAFDAVGIHEDVAGEEPGDYDPNPGVEQMFLYNTFIEDANTLYTTFEDTFVPLTTTTMKGKVSVTDDGTGAVFVGTDSKIYWLDVADIFNPGEQALSDEAFFDNVAVSKDGNRIAAISTEIDTAIYVYDYGKQEWGKFTLYNPTTGDDVLTSGGVLYADAIEFDHTGQYLIYDAYNELNSNTSEDISYWDVGFIRVWDNATGEFGDGYIQKLFTSLPENASIGNPVFSKNSPDIIAFDYFFDDGINEEFAVFGANLETGELNLITENTTLGYPSFAKNDNYLAYSRFESDMDMVHIIPLAADKISAAGTSTAQVQEAKWPVLYATGDRQLEMAPIANFTADFKTGSAPLTVKFVDMSENEPTSWLWSFPGGTPASATVQNPQVVYSTTGIYKVTLKAINAAGENIISRDGYIVVADQTGIEDPKTEGLIFFPNPVSDLLNIICNSDYSLKVFNEAGKLLLIAENQQQIDLSKLTEGLYIMEIKTQTGITRHKLIKE